MQLTGGEYKGIKLDTPNGARPTLSKVREGIFNILYSVLDSFLDKTFLDAFSGSGIMSLEAKSRGFDILAVEKNPKIASLIKANFNKINIKNSIVVSDFLKFIKNTEKKFDVIYMDPPWDFDYGEYIISSKLKLADGGILVIESDKNKMYNFSDFEDCYFKIIKNKIYGRSRIVMIQKGNFLS